MKDTEYFDDQTVAVVLKTIGQIEPYFKAFHDDGSTTEGIMLLNEHEFGKFMVPLLVYYYERTGDILFQAKFRLFEIPGLYKKYLSYMVYKYNIAEKIPADRGYMVTSYDNETKFKLYIETIEKCDPNKYVDFNTSDNKDLKYCMRKALDHITLELWDHPALMRYIETITHEEAHSLLSSEDLIKKKKIQEKVKEFESNAMLKKKRWILNPPFFFYLYSLYGYDSLNCFSTSLVNLSPSLNLNVSNSFSILSF